MKKKKKTKLKPLDTSGIYYSDVIENSKNFKELAGKNYYTISKYKLHLKPNVENIFSSEEQKMKAFNYVKSYRSRRRMNDMNGTMMSSFLDNTGTSFAQTVITARNNRGMLTLNDLRTSNDESTMAHNYVNDEMNNTVITAIKNAEIDNNTESSSGNKLKSKRHFKSKRRKVFLTDEDKELFVISNFGFEVDLSMRKSNCERKLTKESITLSLLSNTTKESFTSESIGNFSFISKKESTLLLNKRERCDNCVSNSGFSLICEKKNDNFTGYIIMEMNNGKEIQNLKCKKNSNVNFMNKELEKGNIQIKQSLLQFVNPNKKEEEKKKMKEGNAQTEIETKEKGENTEKKEIVNEITNNNFELIATPVNTINIESNEIVTENIESQPKRKVLKSKRPNRRNVKEVEQQKEEDKTKVTTNSCFEIINSKKIIENEIAKINEICFKPQQPLKQKILLKKKIPIEEDSPISICIPSSEKPQKKLKSLPKKKSPIIQSTPISLEITSTIVKPTKMQNPVILSKSSSISLAIPSITKKVTQTKPTLKKKISLSESSLISLSFLSSKIQSKQFKSSSTNTNKSKLITEGTNTITKKPKYKINRNTFEYQHTPSQIESTPESVSSLSFLPSHPINKNKSLSHYYTTSILSIIVIVTMGLLIFNVYNRNI